MVLKKFLEQASSTVDDAKYQAESMYHSVIDSVEEATDYTSATFRKAFASFVGTYHALKYAGLSIVLVAAPVPTLVAIAVLWLMGLSIDSIKNDIDGELKDKERKREFDRVVKMLRKYGKIPQTALVETKLVKMEIDSITGNVNGFILSGKFKGVSLAEIDDNNLLDLVSTSPDRDTKSLLESYISYREKAKCIIQ